MSSIKMQSIIAKFLRKLLDLIAWIIGLKFKTNRQYLPAITNPLLLESANTLSAKIKSGQLKCEDLINAYINRCREVQPHINAIIQTNYESAIKEAKHVDRRVRHELDGNDPLTGQSVNDQPLLGIPFTTKDSFAIKDMYWTSGLFARKGIISSNDSPVISELCKAGAIFIALTNVPELIMWWHSTNILYGRTNNPYDKSRIPGGSSGGEGALIAAAGSLIGVGSDIGGSIREPSYFCGTFGHKTTNGIVSTDGIYPMFSASKQQLLSVGPLCRYASDLKPVLKVMAGPNATKLKLDQNVDISQINVYYMLGLKNPAISPLNSEIINAIYCCVDHLCNKCSNVEKIYLKELEFGFDIWMCAMSDSTSPTLEQELANLNGAINPWLELIKSIVGLSNITFPSIVSCFDDLITGLSNEQYSHQLKQMRQLLTERLHSILGDNGVFIFPGHPEIAPKHNGTILKVKNISYTCIFNTLDVAITSVPLGLSSNGLPIGIQVITRPYNDHLSIAVAEELERAFNGWTPPTRVSY